MFAGAVGGQRIPPLPPDEGLVLDNGDGTYNLLVALAASEQNIGLQFILYQIGDDATLTEITTITAPGPSLNAFATLSQGTEDRNYVWKARRQGVLSPVSGQQTIPGTGPVPATPVSVVLGPAANQVTVTPGEPNMQTDVQLWYGTFEFGEIEYQSFTSDAGMTPVVITSGLFPEVNEAQARHFNGSNYSAWQTT